MSIRERYGKFQVYWTNPFTKKKEYQTVETLEEAQKKDALVKYQLQYERDLFRREASQTNKKIITLEDVVFEFFVEKQYSKESLASQLAQLKPWLETLGQMPVTSIEAHHLREVKNRLLRSSKGSTVCRKLAAIKAVLRWAVREEYLKECPKLPDAPQNINQKFVPPSPAELQKLFKVAPPHIQRVLILGSQFGMRVGGSELFKLRWADIDLVRRKLRVDAAKKNAHEQWRELPIREELVDLFRQWEAEDRLLDLVPQTVIHFKGRPVKSIKTAWRTMLKESGVGRNIRPYDLRKFFGTELLANGIDVGTVSKMMGHTSPEMVLKHYQTVLDKREREAVESLPLVSNFRCRTGNARDTLQ